MCQIDPPWPTVRWSKNPYATSTACFECKPRWYRVAFASTAMLEAPYSVPDRFGFVHLQSFVHAKRAEAILLTGRKSHPLSLMLIVAQQICVERSQHDCVHFDRRCICWDTIFIRKDRLDRSYHKTVLFKITTWHNPTLGLKFASVVSLTVSANNLSPLSQLLPNDKPAPRISFFTELAPRMVSSNWNSQNRDGLWSSGKFDLSNCWDMTKSPS